VRSRIRETPTIEETRKKTVFLSPKNMVLYLDKPGGGRENQQKVAYKASTPGADRYTSIVPRTVPTGDFQFKKPGSGESEASK